MSFRSQSIEFIDRFSLGNGAHRSANSLSVFDVVVPVLWIQPIRDFKKIFFR